MKQIKPLYSFFPIRAKKRGKFTKEDERLATSYFTCAIGEIYENRRGKYKKIDYPSQYIYERYGDEKGVELRNLGMDFWNKGINKQDIKQAQLIYNKIQKLK